MRLNWDDPMPRSAEDYSDAAHLPVSCVSVPLSLSLSLSLSLFLCIRCMRTSCHVTAVRQNKVEQSVFNIFCGGYPYNIYYMYNIHNIIQQVAGKPARQGRGGPSVSALIASYIDGVCSNDDADGGVLCDED